MPTASKLINSLANTFETAREQKDINSLKIAITSCEKVELEKFTDNEKGIFYYNLSNAWSYYQKFNLPP